MRKIILWDLDGTLIYSDKLWSRMILKVLDEFEHGHTITRDDIAKCIDAKGLPWHDPQKDYDHLIEPDKWWKQAEIAFKYAYIDNGIDAERAGFLARKVRDKARDYKNYSLYDDTLDVLKKFKENGYINIILTNHMPEIEEVANDLGIMEYVEKCITSALVGYEKPRREIFEYAIKLANNPEFICMVGDNPHADIWGAENSNIPAILVRRNDVKDVKFYSENLHGVFDLVSRM